MKTLLMAKRRSHFLFKFWNRHNQFFSTKICHNVWAKMAYIHSNRANFEPNTGESISRLTQMFNLHTKSLKTCWWTASWTMHSAQRTGLLDHCTCFKKKKNASGLCPLWVLGLQRVIIPWGRVETGYISAMGFYYVTEREWIFKLNTV